MTTIERNGKRYVHNTISPGYYGLIVPPGSPHDNTIGQVGIHWVYLQCAPDTELVREMRALLRAFAALEAEEAKKAEEKVLAHLRNEDERVQNLLKSGICPKCGTWCYGDCTA